MTDDTHATHADTRQGDGARQPYAPAHPEQIGRYRILTVLGEGGMGTVYEAEQDQPRRTVALKVVRADHVSPALLRRFEHEADLLGRLQHPGIAQVYEAGTVPDARGRAVPFFAMELVRGEALTDYADRRKLGVRERLDLLAHICDAVEHAHQKGVIHRDLKPANILVDADGQPKILDFGIARATDGDVQRSTLLTEVGQILGTLEYMSPEQVAGDPRELDTRSDVYALGVVAYELLSGQLPFDAREKALVEVLRLIREDEPRRLSQVDRKLRGDVETIVAKALQKEKARRYPSADALASDIRRFLRDEPIAARPTGGWYQAVKFARRNRGLVAGLAAAFVALVLGLIGTSVGLRRAVDARDAEQAAREAAQRSERDALAARGKAELASVRADKVASFLSDILGGLDRSVAKGRDTTMIRELVDTAAARIERGELDDNPEAELQLRDTIGNAYSGLSDFDAAERMLAPTVELARRVFAGDDRELAVRLNDLGILRQRRGDLAGAEPLLEEALALRRRAFPGDHDELAVGLENLAVLRADQGNPAAAVDLLQQVVAMRRRLAPAGSPSLAHALTSLGALLEDERRIDEAEAQLREAAAIYRAGTAADAGDDHELVPCLVNLGTLLVKRDAFDAAQPLLDEALASARRLYPDGHQDTASALAALGLCAERRGDLDTAALRFDEALAMDRDVYGDDHRRVAIDLTNVARLCARRGDPVTAELRYRDSLALSRRLGATRHVTVADTMVQLAELLKRRGDAAGAEQLYRDAIELAQGLTPPDDVRLARWHIGLGILRRGRGDLDEAERLLQTAVDLRRRLYPDGHADTAGALGSVAIVATLRGDGERAEALLREALAMNQRLYSSDAAETLRAQALLGECLGDLAWQQRDRAEQRALATSRADEAVALLRDTVAAEAAGAGGDTAQHLLDRCRLASALVTRAAVGAGDATDERLRRLGDAETQLLAVLDVIAAAENGASTYRSAADHVFAYAARLAQLWETLEPGSGKRAAWTERHRAQQRR